MLGSCQLLRDLVPGVVISSADVLKDVLFNGRVSVKKLLGGQAGPPPDDVQQSQQCPRRVSHHRKVRRRHVHEGVALGGNVLEHVLEDQALSPREVLVILEQLPNAVQRRVVPIRPLRVLRIERAQQQVPVNLGGVSDAQKRPLVMVERVVLVRSSAEVWARA